MSKFLLWHPKRYQILEFLPLEVQQASLPQKVESSPVLTSLLQSVSLYVDHKSKVIKLSHLCQTWFFLTDDVWWSYHGWWTVWWQQGEEMESGLEQDSSTNPDQAEMSQGGQGQAAFRPICTDGVTVWSPGGTCFEVVKPERTAVGWGYAAFATWRGILQHWN